MINVRKYRAMLGLTQDQLAQKLNCSRTNVVYLESDDCNSLSKENEQKLCEIFNCDIIDLYGLDNLKHIPQNDKQRINLIISIYKEIQSNESREKLVNIIRGYK